MQWGNLRAINAECVKDWGDKMKKYTTHYNSTPKKITFYARLCNPMRASHTTRNIENVNCPECLKLIKEKGIK